MPTQNEASCWALVGQVTAGCTQQPTTSEKVTPLAETAYPAQLVDFAVVVPPMTLAGELPVIWSGGWTILDVAAATVPGRTGEPQAETTVRRTTHPAAENHSRRPTGREGPRRRS